MEGPPIRDGGVVFARGTIVAAGDSKTLQREHPDAQVRRDAQRDVAADDLVPVGAEALLEDGDARVDRRVVGAEEEHAAPTGLAPPPLPKPQEVPHGVGIGR